MLSSIKQLLTLARKTDKLWLLPILLLLITLALIIISSSISPLPLFLYPLV
ncbi:MAG: hypothetical protein HYT10_03290 [Candidatus Levybacteria bacterium]|nr:hypothetical protein [Candidatus Levybacteria bacterium]